MLDGDLSRRGNEESIINAKVMVLLGQLEFAEKEQNLTK